MTIDDLLWHTRRLKECLEEKAKAERAEMQRARMSQASASARAHSRRH